jgi:hypothetical protein
MSVVHLGDAGIFEQPTSFPAWYDPGSVDEEAMQKFMKQVQELRDTNTKSRDPKIRLVRVSKT